MCIHSTYPGIFGFTPSNLTMSPWHFFWAWDTAAMRPVSAGATGLGLQGMGKAFLNCCVLLGHNLSVVCQSRWVNTITSGFMWFLQLCCI